MSTQNNWIVLKFGGTSVSSKENWESITGVLNEAIQDGKKICLVHSALSGVSNLLEDLLEKAIGGDYEETLKAIEQKHYELADDLGLSGKEIVGDHLNELHQIITGISLVEEVSPRVHARVLSLGELMSTQLSAAYLKEQGIDVTWVDAREVLTSSSIKYGSEKNEFLSATCHYEADPELRQQFEDYDGMVLTQGFIASNKEGRTVLLGRGGSDVSASYFAARLEAERLEIWTDVPGMFTADPRTIPSSRLLKILSYDEAQEIATNGAKVLHPRSILPAQHHGIPIYIKCTSRPDLEGTIISDKISKDRARVKAISMRKGVVLVTMETVGMWQQVGFLADAFTCFKEHGLSIDLVSTSETSVTVSLDPGANQHFDDVRDALKEDLEEICEVRIIESCAAVSLLGRQIRAILHQLGPTLEVFEDQQIYMLSQAANDLNFTFVVDEENANRLIKQLHELLIYKIGNDTVFGPTWEEIFKPKRKEQSFEGTWWSQKRDQLLALADEKGPVYVYNGQTLDESVEQLESLEAVERVFYAVKANCQPDVLKKFYEAGLGFECVSPGEIALVKELFPEINGDRILFTPNFAPKEEYEQALDEGVMLTIDNLFILKQWPELFEGQDVFIRIDPGKGRGHHRHVRTGGTHSKFGIPLFEMDELEQAVKDARARVVGLHAHSGSGILQHRNWKDTAMILADVAQRFPDVKTLDLGGGLGIKEKPGQHALDMEALNKTLLSVKDAFPNLDLWIEPGRYLVAKAGVLLAHITQLKGKGAVKYVGLETGMNSLIRPALYGSYHPVTNLSKMDEPASEIVNVVGPICETGDKLGIDRLFPISEEGDIVLIDNAGAYGYVMSSNYNLRKPAREVFLKI